MAIKFQSTPPGWEATLALTAFSVLGLFQSTPPGWEATFFSGIWTSITTFQSTPPGWEATRAILKHFKDTGISIHASRVGGDCKKIHKKVDNNGFQSTPPGWEATNIFASAKRII